MSYNLIGDIHGRTCWRNLVNDQAINIFLGDYLDPYDPGCTIEQTISNLRDILTYKREHPETILLLGNHDLHYLWGEHYSRFDHANAERIRTVLTDELLPVAQLACTIGSNVLVTHAGVTRPWWDWLCQQFGTTPPQTPQSVAATINILTHGTPLVMEHFLGTVNTFDDNDFYGTSPTASPIWVRPETLLDHNLFQGTKWQQIVGHTQVEQPMLVEGVAFIDCLENKEESFTI